MGQSNAKIKEEICGNDVVLFMKGTSNMPQCGFSSRVAGVLNYLDVTYQDINVFLTDGACLRFEDVGKYAYYMKESFKAKDGDAMLALQDKAYELRKNYYTQERKGIDD